MPTELITIRVDTDAARCFRSLTPEEQLKMGMLLSLRLTELMKPGPPLTEVIREVSRKAQAP